MPTIAAKSSASPPTVAAPAVTRRDPRRRVLDAATACFTRAGFHATSMHEICAAADMSPGALYRYFPSKDAIIIAIVEAERTERATLVAALDTAPTFIAALTEMGRRLFSGETSLICAELGPEIFAEATRNPTLKTMFDSVEAEIDEAMRRALLKAQERGEVARDLDIDTVLLVLNAIGDGLLLRSRINPEIEMAARMPALGALVARMLAPTQITEDRVTEDRP